MAEHADREHFLPIRKSDVVDLLCRSKSIGTGAMLTASEQEQFRRLCTILGSFFHHEYRERLEALKDAYAPFDPDRDTLDVQPVSESQRQQRLESLFQEFDGLLQRANFIRLDHDRIVQATQSVSAWGINLDVDFNCFDRMEIYVRGERNGIRPLRIWYKPWAIREERVRQYQRLVLILKQRPHRRLGRNADTKSVLLKLFKDIPTDDLEMLLPGGRVKMPKFERGKLGASLLSAVGFAGFKIYNDVLQVSATFFQQNPLSLYGPLSIVLGYGYKQYYAFQTSRQHYSHRLTESLYYQNLDSNGGVLYRLLDEGEEQDCREAYLAYYHLWRNAPADGWTTAQLDDYIEIELERTLNLKFDFEVDDAIAKLERLNLVVKSGDRYRSVPIDEALRRIDEIWDNIFPYNQ